jgi:hypothetical protein
VALDLAHAKYLALEAVRGEIDVEPVDSLAGPAPYFFDPSGWLLFVAVYPRHQSDVGGSEYVAVHPETGEVRLLGILGE